MKQKQLVEEFRKPLHDGSIFESIRKIFSGDSAEILV